MAVRNQYAVAALHLIKLDVQREILIQRGKMTYSQIACDTGLADNEISAILSGRLSKFRAERMLMIAIRMGMVPRVTFAGVNITDPAGDLRKIKAIESEVIQSALTICGGDMSKAARHLGMGRSTLYRKLKRALS